MKEIRDALKMPGMKDESYDALLRRLIEAAKCQILYRELDENTTQMRLYENR